MSDYDLRYRTDTSFEYAETERWKKALVGRSILSTVSEGSGYGRVLSFVLDDGTILKAHAADGGCSCDNGCFTVEPGNVIRGTITNVEVREFDGTYSRDGYVRGAQVEPGTVEQAFIDVFVYSDLGEQLLISSEGGDNGYYGWGFWLSIHAPEVSR